MNGRLTCSEAVLFLLYSYFILILFPITCPAQVPGAEVTVLFNEMSGKFSHNPGPLPKEGVYQK